MTRTWLSLTAITLIGVLLSFYYLDENTAYWLHAQELAGLDWYRPFFRTLSRFGDAVGWLVGGVLFLAIHRFCKKVDYTLPAFIEKLHIPILAMVASVGITGITVNILKIIIGRARPRMLFREDIFGFEWFMQNSDYASFPSGHATTVFAIASTLLFFTPKLVRAPLFIMATFIASSRVVVMSHYPGDIMAGALLGTFMGYYIGKWFDEL